MTVYMKAEKQGMIESYNAHGLPYQKNPNTSLKPKLASLKTSQPHRQTKQETSYSESEIAQ